MSTRNNSKANRSLKKSKEAKGFSSQKSLLPSIKDPISPGLFNSSISHKDLSKTPKIIRKQATFKYFPNIEESKSQFRSEENKSLTNRDTFDINFSGKTASKSAISKNEIGKLSSLLIEKVFSI